MSNSDIVDIDCENYKQTDYDRYIENKKKKRNFINLPRWKKSNLRVRLNNKIRSDNIRWKENRLFFTRDYIDPEARCSWCDFYFPSLKDKFTLYSAYIHQCQEVLEEIAEEALKKELDPLYDKYVGHIWKWEVEERDAWGKPVTYTDADPYSHTRTYSELDNLSFYDYRKKRISEYLQENKPTVHEKYAVDVNNGRVGLFLVMDVSEELITSDVINKRIQHFYDLGEPLTWQSFTPVPEDKLVYSADWRKEKQLSLGNMLIGMNYDKDDNRIY